MARKKGDQPGKAGVASLAKKLDNSRHGFDEPPASRKKAGAFANEEQAKGARDSSRGATKPAKRKTLPQMKKSS